MKDNAIIMVKAAIAGFINIRTRFIPIPYLNIKEIYIKKNIISVIKVAIAAPMKP